MKKWLKRLLKEDERGLTLVELLAVVVILGIVGAIAFVSIGNIIDNSKKDAHVANAMQVISAAELYRASGGEITSTTDVASLDTIGELTNPWDESNYTDDFKIDTSGDEITVESTTNKCSFGPYTKAELSQNREDICNTSK